MSNLDTRNKYFFGLGTVGRDMFYSFQANAILYFLSDVLSLPIWVFGAASMVLSFLRIFDAVNDPFMGLAIDNVRSPWGKFKPAIVVGGVFSIIFYLLLFSGLGEGWTFILIFGGAYLLWDIAYGINDIGYWTLLPELSQDQKQREKNGTFARICANIGVYIIMVGWQPITSALGDTPQVWFWLAAALSVVFAGFMCFTLFGVKEPHKPSEKQEHTMLKEMWKVLTQNDQLMSTMVSMTLFMVSFNTTVGFAIYYMKYIFGNEGMYVAVVALCGITQLATLGVYPYIAKYFNRKKLYTLATILVVAGYAVFFVAEISIVLVLIGTVLVFAGQAIIQTLMTMFLADTVEYGEWKFGKRNESITFSVQGVVYKIGGALSTGVVSLTLILSGIKIDNTTAETIDIAGKLMVKGAMFIIPVIMIILGYIIYLKKYKISEEFYSKILEEIKAK